MRPFHENLAARLLHRMADAIGRHPRWFLFPQLILTAGCIFYILTHLGFTTRRADLISAKAKYQSDFLRLQQEFRMHDSLVAIVESEDRDKNREFVERLAARLRADSNLFKNIYYKGDLKLMGPKGLLLLPERTLEDLAQTIQTNRALIETFSQANNLNALFELVNARLRSLAETPPAMLPEDSLVRALPALERVVRLAAKSVTHSSALYAPGVEALLGDSGGSDHQSIYLTFGSGRIYILAAQAASEEKEAEAVLRLRALVEQTRPEVPGVNAGITGQPVLEHDEMRQARRDTDLAAVVSLALSALIFIYGYHEWRRPLMATLALLVGIVYTLGFATLAVHRLNILSITLVPILVGLGIDFGVHLIARYEEELRRGISRAIAIRKALTFTGIGIFTSGFTMAAAFFAMLLTDFKGIREMGLISGVGLVVCLIPMMTLLPILLLREKPRPLRANPGREHGRRRRWLEQFCLHRPWTVLLAGAAVTLFSCAQFSKLRFDYNLLHLQTSGLAAVGLERKLLESASRSLLYCAVIADSLPEALEMEQKIERLPSVASVVSLTKVLTEDQQGKLRAVRRLKEEIGALRIPDPDGRPVDLAALARSLSALDGYLAFASERFKAQGPNNRLAAQVSSLSGAIGTLRKAIESGGPQTSAHLAAFQDGVLNDLQEVVSVVARQEDTERLRVEDLPPFLRDMFISPGGRFLTQIYPKGDIWQREIQEAFLRELRGIDPDVTGSPVQFYEYTAMLKQSFQKAALYAVGVIAIVMFFHFRTLISVLLAFVPVILGAAWTLGLMGLLDIPFNPVNIMSLTLIIGIGVTSGIHILNRLAEESHAGILSRSTGKAVLVSAMTTMAGFGSLMVAKHQGIASLGAVMLAGTGMCMIVSLALLPAILTLLNRAGWSVTREKRPGGG